MSDHQFMVPEVDHRGSCILFQCSSHCTARQSKTVTGFTNAGDKQLFLSIKKSINFEFFYPVLGLSWPRPNWRTLSKFGKRWYSFSIISASTSQSPARCTPSRTVISTPEWLPLLRTFLWLPSEEIIDDEGLSKSSPFRSYFNNILEENTASSMAGT